MAKRFQFRRQCVAELARTGRMQDAMKPRADKLATDAGAASSQARTTVEPTVTNLVGIDRAGYRVTDVGEDSLRREFGTPRDAGARVLGRLTDDR